MERRQAISRRGGCSVGWPWMSIRGTRMWVGLKTLCPRDTLLRSVNQWNVRGTAMAKLSLSWKEICIMMCLNLSNTAKTEDSLKKSDNDQELAEDWRQNETQNRDQSCFTSFTSLLLFTSSQLPLLRMSALQPSIFNALSAPLSACGDLHHQVAQAT